jgi:hypothetical protein
MDARRRRKGSEILDLLICRGSRRCGGQVGCLPGCKAARNLGDGAESGPLQEACSNRRTIAAGTVDQQGTIFGQGWQMVREMVERDGEAALDVLLFALARRADVDSQRRLSGGQTLRGGLCAEVFRGGNEFGPRVEGAQSIFKIASDVVEADADSCSRPGVAMMTMGWA